MGVTSPRWHRVASTTGFPSSSQRRTAGTAPGGMLPLPNATTTTPSCSGRARSSIVPSSPTTTGMSATRARSPSGWTGAGRGPGGASYATPPSTTRPMGPRMRRGKGRHVGGVRLHRGLAGEDLAVEDDHRAAARARRRHRDPRRVAQVPRAVPLRVARCQHGAGDDDRHGRRQRAREEIGGLFDRVGPVRHDDPRDLAAPGDLTRLARAAPRACPVRDGMPAAWPSSRSGTA